METDIPVREQAGIGHHGCNSWEQLGLTSGVVPRDAQTDIRDPG